MKNPRIANILLLLVVSVAHVIGQDGVSKVSMIGDDEQSYERLSAECPTMLLEVTSNQMDQAYKSWTGMLVDMQEQADQHEIDIKGVKVWLNVFWAADGSITGITYYPKPTCKNIDFKSLTLFLEDFAQEYTLDLNYENCFAHYGSASFPIHPHVVARQAK